jgi:hypothetical protein|eukprot:COSAG02_NODE_1277_length_13502_cov_14.551593_9_plen_31_part_00
MYTLPLSRSCLFYYLVDYPVSHDLVTDTMD